MPNFTRQAILDTFGDMLQEMPFDKITVSAIVRRCGVSPNTFYYHFKDIYDILDVWLRSRLREYTSVPTSPEEWKNTAKAFLLHCRDEKKLIRHILESRARGRMEKFVFGPAEEWSYSVLRQEIGNGNVTDGKLKEIAALLCCVFVGFFLRFVWNRMEDDIDASVNGLWVIIEGLMESLTEDGGDAAE